VDLRFGQTVLDVGTGTGNTALSAARRGARVVGLDALPSVIALARERARAETLRIRFVTGAAEFLPIKSDLFAVTLSSFGTMFSTDPDATAEELVRVTTPGGSIGLASWTSGGLIGQIYTAVAGTRGDRRDPTDWGNRDQISAWFGSYAGAMNTATRMVRLRGPSAEQFVDYIADTLGPVKRAMEARGPEAQAELRATLVELCKSANAADDGTFSAPAEYLEVVIRLR
jgi:ubiquinone/menaquinone biosynthesis C-methylase UbiE